MGKKIRLSLLLLTVALLSGCCMKHEWKEASCTEPKTCVKCGETEGEALGHTWVEATCEEPKHCSVCGLTEGEALGHKFTEVNYQQPATCTVCGKTEGEPLQADFEKYGLECNAVLNQIYDSPFACYNDESKTTIAKTIFSNYKIFDADEEHPGKDGYEWRTVDVAICFYDENAQKYGWKYGQSFEDYYNIVDHDESSEYDDNGIGHFTVNYKGDQYSECEEQTVWKDNRIKRPVGLVSLTEEVLVPKNYDGYVYGIRNSQIPWEDGQYIFDLDNTDTIFFRFANLDDIKQTENQEVNLTQDEVLMIMNHLCTFYVEYIQMYAEKPEEVISFFDFNGNGNIDNAEEFSAIMMWIQDNYDNDDHSITEENTSKLVVDYLAGEIQLPDHLYNPVEANTNSSNTD